MKRLRRKPIPSRIKIQPINKPPEPRVAEQPVLLPEEIERLKAKKDKEVKHEDKKADMPRVWEHRELQG